MITPQDRPFFWAEYQLNRQAKLGDVLLSPLVQNDKKRIREHAPNSNTAKVEIFDHHCRG